MGQTTKEVWNISPALLAAAASVGLLTSILVTGPTGAATPAASDPGLALQADFVRVVHAVRASVVEISTTSGLGSGVVYDNKGDIVTNAHVVGTETSFTVSLSSGQRTDRPPGRDLCPRRPGRD